MSREGRRRGEDVNPLTIFPNPAKDYTVLYFSLNNSTEVKLIVTNVLGQIVETKNFGALQAGDQSIKYELGNLNAGVYIFTISGSNNRYVKKKVVVQ